MQKSRGKMKNEKLHKKISGKLRKILSDFSYEHHFFRAIFSAF